MADHVDFDDTEVVDLRREELKFDPSSVKDSWDDPDEEEAPPPPPKKEDGDNKGVVKPKKLTAKEKAAEKEADKRRQEELIRLQLEAANKTPEQIAEEKRRIQKEQEDADFEAAKDTFGLTDSSPVLAGVLDSFEPSSLESFNEFRNLLTKKMLKYQTSEYFSAFLNSLFQDLSLHMPADEVRKYGATLTTLAGEKAKQDKEKAGKGKAKPKKKTGPMSVKKDDSMTVYNDDYDEMEDFI